MEVRVGKLTVHTGRHGAGRDAGFRVRTESHLRSLDIRPPGMPERAVLIVRRMQLGFMDHTAAQRARTSLDEIGRAATRPAAGPVATSAQAVLFADEVELLACLTADLALGTARDHWYWRQICPAAADGRGAELAAAWTRDVRWLPGCFARLPESAAHQAVSLLSPQQSSRVLRALLAAFGAGQPSPPSLSRDPARSQMDPPDPLVRESRPDQPGPLTPGPDGGHLSDPPWRQWLPTTAICPHAEALLGTALALHYAPTFVRRPTYSARLAAWRTAADNADWRQAPSGGHGQRAARHLGVPLARASPGAGYQSPGTPVLADAGAETSTGPVRAQALGEAVMPGPPGMPDLPAEDRVEADRAPPRRPVPMEPSGNDEVADRAPPRRQVPMEPSGNDEAADPRPWMPTDGEIATGLASLLFLVNFVVWLDTEEEDSCLPTGWALVELLGRHLLGARLGDLADDPLWDVLAELDGRPPGTPPGFELDAAAPLRLPRAWLRRWPPPGRTYIAHWDRNRLMVRHPEAGFVVADVPCPADRADEMAAAEAALLEDSDVIVDGSVAGAAPAAERRFGEAVGAFVSWLLRSSGIAVSSLMSPGLVRVTSTHVDVVLGLDDVDLAARMAGLDRDPGWVPLLGRIVLFHFLEARFP